MPPNAAVNEGMGAGLDLVEYRNVLEGGSVVKVVKGPEFSMADFRPVKDLGSGDMGNVVLVEQKNSKAPYAMKVIRKDVLLARKNAHRAETERDILASVNHPFLPVLHSHFEDEKHMFFVMNYCHGGDLNLLRKMQPEKRFSENASRFYVAEVLLALEYLHKRNILYRDLKPENVLVQPDGHIMLTDFDLSLDLSKRKWTKPAAQSKGSSIALMKKSRASHMKAFFACGSPASLVKMPSKKAPNSRVTPEELYTSRKRGAGKSTTSDGPANSFVGTEEYIAPEIIWGKGHGLAVDWWTLGIFLFELFYGKTPFKGLNRKETFYNVLCKPVIFPGLTSPLTDLILKLLAKEPEDRLGSKGGADEIKNHPFFNGVNWDELEYVSRAPVVPEPFSWEQIEENLAAKAKALGKEVQVKWSFCETTDSPDGDRKDASGGTPSELSLKCDDSSFQNGLIAKSLLDVDTAPSTPRDNSLEDENGSEDAFSLHSQADRHKQSTSTTPKEEVRLDDDLLVEQGLFEDVF